MIISEKIMLENHIPCPLSKVLAIAIYVQLVCDQKHSQP